MYITAAYVAHTRLFRLSVVISLEVVFVAGELLQCVAAVALPLPCRLQAFVIDLPSLVCSGLPENNQQMRWQDDSFSLSPSGVI